MLERTPVGGQVPEALLQTTAAQFGGKASDVGLHLEQVGVQVCAQWARRSVVDVGQANKANQVPSEVPRTKSQQQTYYNM
jgi:hypothetical protein